MSKASKQPVRTWCWSPCANSLTAAITDDERSDSEAEEIPFREKTQKAKVEEDDDNDDRIANDEDEEGDDEEGGEEE